MFESTVGDEFTDLSSITDGKATTGRPAAPAPPRVRRAKLLRAGEIEPQKVDWLWKGRIPAGMLTVLGGTPGLGKSLLTAELAARVTQGTLGAPPADVLFLSAEDSIANTIIPRLKAARANLDRVSFPVAERNGFETPLLLPTDVDMLNEFVVERKARLVVVDPLAAHLDGINSWKDQEIREALAPVHQLAASTGAAVLLVAHLNKGSSTDPLQRLGGSIGLPAAARSVLLLAPDPDDPDGDDGANRVLAHVKSNISEHAPSLLLRIDPLRTAGLEVPRIRETGISRYTGAQLLIPDRAPRGSRLAEATAFLQTELAGGEQPAAGVERRANQAGISESTLGRARQALGVRSRKLAFDNGWGWSLPGVVAAEAA
jgi:hypothetical protein